MIRYIRMSLGTSSSFVHDNTFSREGFRRLLIAIYSHTSSLLIAAPMAHFIARNKSRFQYSHKFEYVPLRSLSYLLKGETSNMRLVVSNGRRVPYCRALDYLSRPSEFEQICPWKFYLDFTLMSRHMAEENDIEHFELLPDHPKSKNYVCVHLPEPRKIKLKDFRVGFWINDSCIPWDKEV